LLRASSIAFVLRGVALIVGAVVLAVRRGPPAH